MSAAGGCAAAGVAARIAANKIAAHPDFDATKTTPATLDNKGCTFVPHIVLVRTGQPFVIKNSDPVGHNTNVKLMKNGASNVTIVSHRPATAASRTRSSLGSGKNGRQR